MLKIASAFVVGMVGFLMFSLVPPEVADRIRAAVERSVDIQIDHFRH
jgi:hypothetical protein